MLIVPNLKSIEQMATAAVESGDPFDAQRFASDTGMQPIDFLAQLQANGPGQMLQAIWSYTKDSLETYYSKEPIVGGDAELLSDGWLINHEANSLEFSKTIGGEETLFASYEFTVTQDPESGAWTPMHGSVKMAPEKTSVDAANALWAYWHGVNLSDRVKFSVYDAFKASLPGGDAAPGVFSFRVESKEKLEMMLTLMKDQHGYGFEVRRAEELLRPHIKVEIAANSPLSADLLRDAIWDALGRGGRMVIETLREVPLHENSLNNDYEKTFKYSSAAEKVVSKENYKGDSSLGLGI